MKLYQYPPCNYFKYIIEDEYNQKVCISKELYTPFCQTCVVDKNTIDLQLENQNTKVIHTNDKENKECSLTNIVCQNCENISNAPFIKCEINNQFKKTIYSKHNIQKRDIVQTIKNVFLNGSNLAASLNCSVKNNNTSLYCQCSKKITDFSLKIPTSACKDCNTTQKELSITDCQLLPEGVDGISYDSLKNLAMWIIGLFSASSLLILACVCCVPAICVFCCFRNKSNKENNE